MRVQAQSLSTKWQKRSTLVPVVAVEADELAVLERRAGIEALGIGRVVLDEIHFDVEVLRIGTLHWAAFCTALAAAASMRSTASSRVDGGHAVAAPLVDRHGGDGGDELAGEVAQRLVAGDERHGHAVVAGGVGVEQKFAAHCAVEGHVVVFEVHGMAEGVARAARPGMVAGEKYGVEMLLVKPRHHRERVAGPGAMDARPARAARWGRCCGRNRAHP